MPTTKTKNSLRSPGKPALTAEVLTLAEAAKYLRVTENEVLRMVREQHLPGRQIGREWRFSAPALQAWLGDGPSEKEKLMRLAGAWKGDPHLEQVVKAAYEARNQASAENGR